MKRNPQGHPTIMTKGLAPFLNSKANQGSTGYLNSSPQQKPGVKNLGDDVLRQHQAKFSSLDIKLSSSRVQTTDSKKSKRDLLHEKFLKLNADEFSISSKSKNLNALNRKSSNEIGNVGAIPYSFHSYDRKIYTAQNETRPKPFSQGGSRHMNSKSELSIPLPPALRPFTREMLKSAGRESGGLYETHTESLIDEHYLNVFDKLNRHEAKDLKLSEEIYFTPEQQKFIKEKTLKNNSNKGRIQIYAFEENEQKMLELDAEKGVYFRIHTEILNFPLKFTLSKESGICEVFCSSHDLPTKERYESKYISTDFSINYNRFHPSNIMLFVYAHIATKVMIKFKSYRTDFLIDGLSPRRRQSGDFANFEAATKPEINSAGSEANDETKGIRSQKNNNILKKNILIVPEFHSRKLREMLENQEEHERKMLKVKFKREKNILIRRNESMLKSLKKDTKKEEMLSKLKEIQQKFYKRIWWGKWLAYMKLLIISQLINDMTRAEKARLILEELYTRKTIKIQRKFRKYKARLPYSTYMQRILIEIKHISTSFKHLEKSKAKKDAKKLVSSFLRDFKFLTNLRIKILNFWRGVVHIQSKWKHHMVGFKEKLDILTKVWDERIFMMLSNETHFTALLNKIDTTLKSNPKFHFQLADLQNISIQEKVLALTLHLNKSYNNFYRELSKYLALTKDLNRTEGHALKFVNTVQDSLEAAGEDDNQQNIKREAATEKKSIFDKDKLNLNTKIPKSIKEKGINNKAVPDKASPPKRNINISPLNLLPKQNSLNIDKTNGTAAANAGSSTLPPEQNSHRSYSTSRQIKKPHIEIQSSQEHIEALILEVLIKRRRKELDEEQKSKNEMIRRRTTRKKAKKKKNVKISANSQQLKEKNSVDLNNPLFLTEGQFNSPLRKKRSMASENEEYYQGEEEDELYNEGDQEEQEGAEHNSRPITRSGEKNTN